MRAGTMASVRFSVRPILATVILGAATFCASLARASVRSYHGAYPPAPVENLVIAAGRSGTVRQKPPRFAHAPSADSVRPTGPWPPQIGRASCREREYRQMGDDSV